VGEEALDKSEVAAGDARYGGDRFGVRESPAESVSPIALQWCSRTNVSSSLLSGRYSWAEPDPRVQLRVARRPPLDARHADQDEADAGALVVVAQLLEARRLQAVRFVGDQ
jgi:hypothetical protein